MTGTPENGDSEMNEPINIIFDGPPGPEAGRFVEVENDAGASISVGEWVERPDGMWALRIKRKLTPCIVYVPESWRPQP